MTEVLAGLLAPLVAVAASWTMAAYTYRRTPERMTAVMIAGFGVKALFFGAYVAVAIKGLALRPAPFVASFTTAFISLYLAEALYLKRLFAGK